ncbi:dienelactone hydrolase family protein [Amycolatopsis sp. PS_44_ISF1]|uniref:dienelactone hydrolase family protein n=1 Tax=Amycolatopsis sp. PS_44_ISF1 TaxID=2974917 RepID=UPI0028DD68B4|nr:dienelactone hydrolase family protein [Amycolatopsis sp. PS_44_ISF1]MDT8911247.1 dienelactone hydrolase family protein [Amycolatopsis sp. PS_44_ISF1]
MPRTPVTIPTPDGSCPATLHTPDPHPHPAVVLHADAAGVRETFAEMADRLAAFGYAVLLPDAYYRTPFAPFDVATVFTVPEERQRLSELSASLTTAQAVRDMGAYLEFLAGRPEVSGSAVGTTGYCMGGRLSLLAAAHHPERVAASASFHGGNLAAADDAESPYRLADRIRATVYVAAAQNDKSFPPEQYERLGAALAGARVRHTLVTYPAEHGFAVADNPTYDPEAGRRHWEALAELYAENLNG